jgi:exodeoxyribonuclease V alpha subunit
MAESLQGTVQHVTYHSDENGYAVLRVVTAAGPVVTVTGRVPFVTVGETIQASGEWMDTRDYGKQFKAEQITLAVPATLDGIERYLGSGLIDGIGPTYAKKLIDHFGESIFSVIEQESRRLEEVEGIGEKRRKIIRESWMSQKAVHDIMVFLFQNGLGTGRARRIHQAYGENAIGLIRQNPWRLAEDIDGIGFATADSIARNMGKEPHSRERIRAGLLHTIQEGRQAGQACLPRSHVITNCATLLDANSEEIERNLEVLLSEKTLVGADFGSGPMVYAPDLLEGEKVIASGLRALSQMPVTPPDSAAGDWRALCRSRTGLILGSEQEKAVEEALHQRVLVITGGPGVGKTTVVKAILSLFNILDCRVVLAAPTGRAARRLSDSTGREAKTLHRLLEFDPARGFQRWNGRPLEGDLFILDEVSMIDIPLMSQFLRAFPPQARLIMVGDADQLPSVGPGRVLHDVIASAKVPCVALRQVFRQAAQSTIIVAAHAVNAGKMPPLSREKGLDFYLVETPAPKIEETILQLVTRRIPDAYGLDPERDIQILTPMNRRMLGAAGLNEALQKALNPPDPLKAEIPRGGLIFRTGDRVMQLRNNYDKDVFNGDIGHITDIRTEPLHLMVRFEDSRVARYEMAELDELTPAYAITIHKSQGSEFPAVVIPLTTAHFVLLQRNLLYTAITRGKKLVVLVGEARALDMAIKRTEASERYSGLEHWLKR